MKIFIKLNSLQLFFLLFIFPLLIFLAFTAIGESRDNQKLPFMIVPIAGIISAIGLVGWLLSMGIFLYRNLPSNFSMNLRLFKISLSIVLILHIVFFAMLFTQVTIDEQFETMRKWMPFFMMAITIPYIYGLFFIAKSLKCCELQRRVKFKDYIMETVLLFYYVIGIWIIQPRINRLYRQSINLSVTTNEIFPKSTADE